MSKAAQVAFMASVAPAVLMLGWSVPAWAACTTTAQGTTCAAGQYTDSNPVPVQSGNNASLRLAEGAEIDMVRRDGALVVGNGNAAIDSGAAVKVRGNGLNGLSIESGNGAAQLLQRGRAEATGTGSIALSARSGTGQAQVAQSGAITVSGTDSVGVLAESIRGAATITSQGVVTASGVGLRAMAGTNASITTTQRVQTQGTTAIEAEAGAQASLILQANIQGGGAQARGVSASINHSGTLAANNSGASGLVARGETAASITNTGTISASAAAMDAVASNGRAELTNSGQVTGAINAQASGAARITQGTTARQNGAMSVESTMGEAALMLSGQSDGTLTARGKTVVITLAQGASATGAAQLRGDTINATLQGSRNGDTTLTGGTVTATNSGTHQGSLILAPTASATITNSGQITAATAVRLSGTAGQVSLSNTGQITGTSHALDAENQAVTLNLVNRGIISGAMRLGSGDDQVELHASGRFEGELAGGGGTDTLKLSGDSDDAVDLARFSGMERLTVAGNRVLSGQGEFSGGTTLVSGTTRLNGARLGGTLSVAQGAIASGAGTVGSVTNSGTVTLGTADVLTVNGDYTAQNGSTTRIGLAPGANGRIVATGSVILQPGSTLQLAVSGAENLTPGTKFLLAQGASAQTQASLSDDSALLNFTTSIENGNQLYATVANTNGGGGGGGGANPWGSSDIATAISGISTQPWAAGLITALGQLNATDLERAYRQLEPSNDFLELALTAGFDRGLMAASRRGGTLRDRVPATVALADASDGFGAGPRMTLAGRNLGLWVDTGSDWLKAKAQPTIAGGRARSTQMMAGADFDLAPRFYDWAFDAMTIGVSGGAWRGSAQTRGADIDEALKGDGWGAAVSARARRGRWHFDAGISAAQHDFTSHRRLSLVNQQVQGKFDATSVNVDGRAVYEFRLSPNLILLPEAGLRYSHVWRDSYRETGGSAALAVANQQQGALAGRIGLGLSYSSKISETLKLQAGLRMGVEADLTGKAPVATASFAGGSSSFTAGGRGNHGPRAELGASVNLLHQYWGSLGFHYAGQLDNRHSEHRGGLRLSIRF